MTDSFTIQFSSNLVKQLADESEKLKKKPRKPKMKVVRTPQPSQIKVSQKQIPDDTETLKGGPTAAEWPLQTPFYLPVPPPQSAANTELGAIRSVLQDSEKVLERLQKQEVEITMEVTQRAKELHEKEFKLPFPKPMPCSADYNACVECYREHYNNPIKCATFVNNFADCVRSVRQQVHSTPQ